MTNELPTDRWGREVTALRRGHVVADAATAVPTQGRTVPGMSFHPPTGQTWPGAALVEADGTQHAHACDVAIADPDDVSGLLTAEVLRGAGQRVKVADLADVTATPRIAPLIILADPCQTGPVSDTLATLRRQHGGTHPNVIVITATHDPVATADLLDAGADAVLTRPWAPVTLRAIVAAHLRRHHLWCTGAPTAMAELS